MTTNPEPDPGQREEVVAERPTGRHGFVRGINGLISVVTGLFAVALAIHVILVAGEANMGNSFAQFVTNLAGAVDLGLSNLFTMANEKLQVALNEGIAALLWLVIGSGLTTLISRVALPEGSTTWYRRTVR
ncbi:hypothetical protein [Haloechinothrix halophila]|uniref:hypothetical protein n=1 Tax=Haloechinothrix halophila TaxID=1069073 RepID=UPI00040D8798|nr:hypothetical protein [Haloechinothrix halophila]